LIASLDVCLDQITSHHLRLSVIRMRIYSTQVTRSGFAKFAYTMFVSSASCLLSELISHPRQLWVTYLIALLQSKNGRRGLVYGRKN